MIEINRKPESVNGALNVKDRIFEWFSVVQGLKIRDGNRVAFDQIRESNDVES
jgi:hypothetical protein